MFAVVDKVLIRPLPIRDAHRVVVIWPRERATPATIGEVSYATFRDWQRDARGFEQLAAMGSTTWGLVLQEGQPATIPAAAVSASFFALAGANAALGRTLQPADDRKGSARVAVLSHGAWQRRFGGDPAIVGRALRFRAGVYTVVGVMPDGFDYPRGAELWVALVPQLEAASEQWKVDVLEDPGFGVLFVLGRLAPGVTIDAASATVSNLIARAVPAGFRAGMEASLTPVADGKTLFLDSGDLLEPGHKNCNGCHFNGGGSAGMSFNPATPGFPRIDGSPRGFNIGGAGRMRTTSHSRCRWGCLAMAGSGRSRRCSAHSATPPDLPPPFGHLELEEFNSPPVVESADTGPFFHNHTVSDLESSVAFYGSLAFQSGLTPGAIPIAISDDPAVPEVQAIAAFLRVLNALENIRSSIEVAARGRTMASASRYERPGATGARGSSDALEVLSAGALANHDEPAFDRAGSNCGPPVGPRRGTGSTEPAGDRQPAWRGRSTPAEGESSPGRSIDPAAFIPQLNPGRLTCGTGRAC